MSQHQPVRPPPDCPNEGLCISVHPRLESLEQAHGRNDASIRDIRANVDTMQRDLHEVRVTLRERDKNWAFIQSTFIALIVAAGVQISTTIWFASQLSATVEQHGRVLTDHEDRLRFHSGIIGQKPVDQP
jgi:hypothetical protein